MSNRDFSMNRSLLKILFSFSDISAVNFIVGWNLLASLINRVGTCEVFLLYALALIKCISLPLFREHGEIYYFSRIIHRLLILLLLLLL